MFLVPPSLAKSLNLKYNIDGKSTVVNIVEIKKNKVSANCLKNSSCLAMKISNGKPAKIQVTKSPFVGNPGANYCWDVGAKNRILVDEKNNQYDFCVFEDGSMIDAWNLYSKHYPPRLIN